MVVIPTHERHVLLHRALKSVFVQEVPGVEVIVVMDGSQEGYEIALQKYYGRVTFVSLIAGSGVSAARNLGVAVSQGGWIAFLDDDDEYVNGYLGGLIDTLSQVSREIGFVWSAVKVRKHIANCDILEEIGMLPLSSLDKESVRASALSIGAGYGVAVARRCFDSCGGFDETYRAAEDTEFFIRIMSEGYLPFFCNVLGVIVHDHEGDRLPSKFRLRTVRLYEKIFWRHLFYFVRHPLSFSGFRGWIVHCYFKNGYYFRALAFIFRANGFRKVYCAYYTLMLLYRKLS